jgi:hypothetical protein
MTTKELIIALLEMDMDAEVDLVFDGKLEDDQGLKIKSITEYRNYIVIELEAY